MLPILLQAVPGQVHSKYIFGLLPKRDVVGFLIDQKSKKPAQQKATYKSENKTTLETCLTNKKHKSNS
ncbi:hypothetical protein CEXT_744981 [Caerostris extrusa]|uniref:Uncharacterized protein n=1 Tax=Caerostris extrusa TaxID=172846 RepID=A0AAV4NUA7_CAEEX|nr:hypothetical protein CEXT_744981 [Caerostris extrusa]